MIGILREFEAAILVPVLGADDEALALRRRHRLEAGDLGRKTGHAAAEHEQSRRSGERQERLLEGHGRKPFVQEALS